MSSFASLMALSATYTQASQNQAQAKLAERNRREAELKKRRLEQEKKDREREAQLRLKHFEQQKKEEEQKKKKEEERKAIEAAVERRKAAEREALLHGPAKKTSSHRASQVRRKAPADNDDDNDGLKSEPLTREELRERKLQAELRRQFTSVKRSTTTGGYQRHGRHLPGGAVDVTTTGPPAPSSNGQSVKARLAAMPNTLTKLNTVKRDTRTIDEILQDRAKAKELKILDGHEALAFDDWFGTKKKEQTRPSSIGPASGENTPKSTASVARESIVSHDPNRTDDGWAQVQRALRRSTRRRSRRQNQLLPPGQFRNLRPLNLFHVILRSQRSTLLRNWQDPTLLHPLLVLLPL